MSFIRPEVRAQIGRWREVLIGLVIVGVGSWLALTSFGARFIVGIALFVGGIALIIAGAQRARFRRGDSGPGIVQIDERRIRYYGPFHGGSVAIAGIRRLDLNAGRGTWLIWEADPGPLEIPVSAKGADALFDAFGALPGLSTERMLVLLNGSTRETVTVWSREPTRLH